MTDEHSFIPVTHLGAAKKFADRLIETGYLEDEVMEGVEEMFEGLNLHDRRDLTAYVHEAVSAATRPAFVSRVEVLAKQEELKQAGKDYGADSLARALSVSEATIRRRLGRLK